MFTSHHGVWNRRSVLKHASLVFSTDDAFGLQANSLKTSVLTFVALLTTVHTDIFNTLLESQTLIPSLVFLLSHLATPIWEDDELLGLSPTMVVSYVIMHLLKVQCILKAILKLNPNFESNSISPSSPGL